MTRSPTPPLLAELLNSASSAAQVKALTQIKNEIIGHEQGRQDWVRFGLLPPLVHILESVQDEDITTGVQKGQITGHNETSHRLHRASSEDEEARLQAVIIIGSLAHGGPPFLAPLHASHVLSPLLSLLSLRLSSPEIILTTLRSLNNLADSLCLADPETSRNTDSLSVHLYQDGPLRDLCAILHQHRRATSSNQQITLAAALVAKTCHEDSHLNLLVQYGILDALVHKLTTWIASTIPLHGSCKSGQGRLSTLLRTIGLTINRSRARAQHLLESPALANISEQLESESEHIDVDFPSGFEPNAETNASCRLIETLLPMIPPVQTRGVTRHASAYPPFDPIKVSEAQWPRTLSSAVEIFASGSLEYTGEKDSFLVPWLIYVARKSDEVTSLMAMGLLASLHNLRSIKASRETAISLLIIPLLVRLLDPELHISKSAVPIFDGLMLSSVKDVIKEEAPAVLAIFTINNPKLQKAAVEAGAIKKLAELLKESYNPSNASAAPPMWSPSSTEQDVDMTSDGSCTLGQPGISSQVNHVAKIRETTLIALAALGSDKDEYRKSIIESGVVPYIIRTLKAEDVAVPVTTANQSDSTTLGQKMIYGNCREAILAACSVTRALSRSVSTLRTSLMENGLAPPIFTLLKCQDVAIKTAATAVICNLVLQFSPMREAILDGGIVAILCEQAHSKNLGLRLNSLWALKHVVVEASSEVKMSCLETLGTAWLKQLISSDADSFSSSERDEILHNTLRMSTPNAAGEQVDLLNAVDTASRESSQEPEADGDDDLKMPDSSAFVPTETPTSRPPFARNPPSTRSRENATPSRLEIGLPSEVAMVKQGLEFIRNLMLGNDVTKMIDHVLREMGQEDFFKIIASKLRPRILNALNRDRRSSEANGIRHIPPQPELVKSACYILVHIAASQVSHQQLLMSQTKLLELLVPLFEHPDSEIRVACAWVVINLTWEDGATDKQACRERARRLNSLGIYEKVQAMEDDADLDCSERAKNAAAQMSAALR